MFQEFGVPSPIFPLDVRHANPEFRCQSVADPDLHLRVGTAFEGFAMSVEFCKDDSGSSQKMRHFRKNKRGGGERGGVAPPWAPLLDPPLITALAPKRNYCTDISRCDYLYYRRLCHARNLSRDLKLFI